MRYQREKLIASFAKVVFECGKGRVGACSCCERIVLSLRTPVTVANSESVMAPMVTELTASVMLPDVEVGILALAVRISEIIHIFTLVWLLPQPPVLFNRRILNGYSQPTQ